MTASIGCNTVRVARHSLNINSGLIYFGQKFCGIMKHVLYPISFFVKLISRYLYKSPNMSGLLF